MLYMNMLLDNLSFILIDGINEGEWQVENVNAEPFVYVYLARSVCVCFRGNVYYVSNVMVSV